MYGFITGKMKLSSRHWGELRSKRGFTDDTIRRFRFFSGGEDALRLEPMLRKRFNLDELIASGVFIKTKSGAVGLNPMLLDEHIFIPYIDTQGNIYHLRPHKLGFKDVPIKIFQALREGKDCILTEGEFKAVAAWQMGFSAIAVPGISSFAGVHFNELVEFLNNIHKVYIVFDNERKDDPDCPNFKQNPAVRYDTQYYAYLLADKLRRAGKEALVATLPDSWQVECKADIDGALAQGKSYKDMEVVLRQALPPKEYLHNLCSEAQGIIQRKLRQTYYRSHISIDFGRYVVTRKQKIKGNDVEVKIPISNFTIQIISSRQTPEGMLRDIVFVDEFGKRSGAVTIGGSEMARNDSFKAFCMRQGDYIWRGKQEDLDVLWEERFLSASGKHILELPQVGYIEGENAWLFGNVAFHKGKELRPDSDGIFWFGDKGFKPLALEVQSGRASIAEGVPLLNTTSNITIDEIYSKFADTLGDNEAKVLLGWVIAVLYMDYVFNEVRSFPFLFVYGRRGSGKSTIAEWAMNFFGLENSGKIASDTTSVAIQRYLEYYSSLPTFIDEYRNTRDITRKNGFLRNVYNRQTAGKGIKANFGIRAGKIRGTLLLSGEETPDDNALLTRCVLLRVIKEQRRQNHFNWFMKHRFEFSKIIYDILRSYEPDKFITYMRAFKDVLAQRGVDDRTAINYSTVVAGAGMLFGDDIGEGFLRYIIEDAKQFVKEQSEEEMVKTFLVELSGLVPQLKDAGAIYYEDGYLYIWFTKAYEIWGVKFRQLHGIEPFKRLVIKKDLQEIGGIEERCRVDGHLRRWVSFKEGCGIPEIEDLIEEVREV